LFQQMIVKDPFESYAEACYWIEKELGCEITPEYPVAKFMAQLEMLKKDAMRQKRELDKIKFRRGRRWR